MNKPKSVTSQNNVTQQASELAQEQLSALLDNDIATEELDQLLPSLSGNTALRQKAAQWNLIGDAIRAGSVVQSSSNPAAAASPATSGQPADNVIRPNTSRWQKISKPLGGIALAAGVAAVAILVGQQNDPAAGAAGTFTADSGVSVAPVGDNSLPPLTDSQRAGLMAASTSQKPVSAMTASELAQQAKVSSSMNDFTSYQPITREELLQLQQPSAAEQQTP